MNIDDQLVTKMRKQMIQPIVAAPLSSISELSNNDPYVAGASLAAAASVHASVRAMRMATSIVDCHWSAQTHCG